MALTITIPGAVSTTTGSTAPAVLTVGVGSPGAQGATGATGATGPGVAAGGSAGQVLAKIDGTNYNTEWVNVEGDYLPLAGGAMDTDAEVTIAETTGHDSELAGWGLGVELSADHAQGTTVEYNGLNVYDSDGHMIVSPTGLTFPDTSVQSTAFLGYASPAFTGNPTAPTASPGDNDTTIATTAFVTASAALKANIASPTFTGTVTIPSGASITGFAPLASPSLTGTPLSTTASVSTNTTQIATTAFVLGQVGTATPIVNGTAAAGTSLLYARQDHVHGTDTTRAALASPTFTGTPTLPTGTIATTQSPGNNTTALATTAFVTAAVPAFATDAQAQTGTSTTVTVNPANLNWVNKPSSLQQMQWNAVTAVTAGGGGASVNSGTYLCQAATTAISTGMMYIYTLAANRGAQVVSGFNWARSFSATFRFNEASVVTDNNTISRVLFGKNYGTAGDLTAVGVGIRKIGSGYFSLVVHNGTTLTAVASTVNTTATYHDFRITSDGAGNVKLYINDVLECSTSSGPTTAVSQGLYITQESQNTAIVTAPGSNTRLANVRYEFAVS